MNARKPKGAKGEAWGILNPWGDLWTYQTFPSPETATQYITDFWRGYDGGGDLTRFKPVRVRVHVTALPNHPAVGKDAEAALLRAKEGRGG